MTGRGLGAQDARSNYGPRNEVSGYVMDDDKPPENAFRDALIAFAEKYAK